MFHDVATAFHVYPVKFTVSNANSGSNPCSCQFYCAPGGFGGQECSYRAPPSRFVVKWGLGFFKPGNFTGILRVTLTVNFTGPILLLFRSTSDLLINHTNPTFLVSAMGLPGHFRIADQLVSLPKLGMTQPGLSFYCCLPQTTIPENGNGRRPIMRRLLS